MEIFHKMPSFPPKKSIEVEGTRIPPYFWRPHFRRWNRNRRNCGMTRRLLYFLGGGFKYFPTCQVRVVRFYVRCRLLLFAVLVLFFFFVVVLSALHREPLGPVFLAGPSPRPSALSVPCRTSTATICAQCSLPDLNREIE